MAASDQGKKIGLLGGSFNPAHAGHVYISEQALSLLGLDEIWWLVSPQNPLKAKHGMGEYAARLAKAKELSNSNSNIKVSDFELHSGTSYTYDTLIKLKKSFPKHKFVWLMGADNLIQLPKWYKWREIINLIPVAVFNRDNFKDIALHGEVAVEFSQYQIENASKLAYSSAPSWIFLDIKTNPLSSTKLREE